MEKNYVWLLISINDATHNSHTQCRYQKKTYTLIFSLIILPIPVTWYLFFKQGDKTYPVVGILIFAHFFFLLNIR